MISRFKQLALGLIVVNVALVALSLILSWQSTLKYPMKGELVPSGEQQLHVIDSSTSGNSSHSLDSSTSGHNSPTVVLIHGASTSALDFSTNLHPALSERWRVVSVDRPGHGYSDRGDAVKNSDPGRQASMILDALHSMQIDNAVLVGHSWAGSVVMAALLQTHQHVNVRAGVLISGATHPWEGGSAWHVELSAKPVIGTVFRWQYIEPAGRMLMPAAVESVFAPEIVPDNYINTTGLTLSLRPTTYRHNALDVTRLSEYLQSQSKRYSTITQPLLSIAASEDHVVPAWNHHERLLTQVNNIQALEIPGAGHAPHHTQPDVVVNAIKSFLESLD